MVTGWLKSKNIWYYLKESGAMTTGWQKISNKWYYLKSNGAMTTGWQKISGKWHYMNGSGAILTGWNQIGGKWYYMYSSGAMASNTWIGSYYVNGSGVWTKTRRSVRRCCIWRVIVHTPQTGARTGRIRHGVRWCIMKHSVRDMPAG